MSNKVISHPKFDAARRQVSSEVREAADKMAASAQSVVDDLQIAAQMVAQGKGDPAAVSRLILSCADEVMKYPFILQCIKNHENLTKAVKHE